MENVLVQESSLRAIAEAIRFKSGSTVGYTPAQMAQAIRSIAARQTIDPVHCYYNGYLLPTLPTVSGYPYVWIRENSQTGYFDALYAPSVWYVPTPADDISDLAGDYHLKTDTMPNYVWFRCPISDAASGVWTEFPDTSYDTMATNNNRELIFSNENILFHSSAGPDIAVRKGIAVHAVAPVRPETITPTVYNASFITQDKTLSIDNPNYPNFRLIVLNLAQLTGKAITIHNTGNYNVWGLYDSVAQGAQMKCPAERQTDSDGILHFHADDFALFGSYLVYGFTSSAQDPPTVTAVPG